MDMNAETSTDTTALVDSVFDEMECVADTRSSDHGGDKSAYYLSHGCVPDGFVCAVHLKRYIEIRRPDLLRMLDWQGFILCGDCRRQFTSVESFGKVVVL